MVVLFNILAPTDWADRPGCQWPARSGSGTFCVQSPRAEQESRSEEHTSELQSHSFISYAVFFFNDTATTEIYTLSLHDALPISDRPGCQWPARSGSGTFCVQSPRAEQES